MTISKTVNALLFKDYFDTNTVNAAHYSNTGTITWDSGSQYITMASGVGTTATMKLLTTALNVKNMAMTGKFMFDSSSTSVQYLQIYLRHNTGFWYRVSIRDGTSAPNSVLAEYYNGSSVSAIASASYTINRGVWYNFKFGQYFTTTTFKIWPTDQAEPASWLINGGFNDVGTTGSYYLYTYNIASSLDNIGVYLNNYNIKCSGLPTGYKFRVGGVSGATAVESGGTATVSIQHVTLPASLVEVLDGSDVVVDSLTVTGDVWGGDEYSYTASNPATTVEGNFTNDAVLKKARIEGSSTANCNIKKPFTVSALVDVVLKKTISSLALSTDSVLKKSVNLNYTANAVSKKIISGTILTDTCLIKSCFIPVTADAGIVKQYSGNFNTNAVLKKNGVGYTASKDTVLKKTVNGTFSLDSILQQSHVPPIFADVVLRKAVTNTKTADSVFNKNFLSTFLADGYLYKEPLATMERTSTGKLWYDQFVTDTKSNYTLYGTVTYNSPTQEMTISKSDGTESYAYIMIPSASLSVKNMVVSGKFRFGSVLKTTQYFQIVARQSNTPNNRYYAVSIYDGSGTNNTINCRVYDDSNGTNTTFSSLSYVIDRNVDYKYKVSVRDQYFKFKIWQSTEAEPATWAVDTTVYNITQNGNSLLTSAYFDATVDDYAVYKSLNITCTNLPAGYKLRVGGVGGAVGIVSGGTATVDCSHITLPASEIEVLDSLDNVTASSTISGDIWGGDTFVYKPTYTFTANAYLYPPFTRVDSSFPVDAALRKVIGGQFTSNAAARRVIPISFTTDAQLKLYWQYPIVADAALSKTLNFSFLSSTVIRKAVQQQINIDSRLMKIYQSPLATDSTLKKISSWPVTANSVAKKNDIGSNFLAESYLMLDQTYTLNRSSTGKLLYDRFDTNTLSNYTTGGTAVYSSANKNVELGLDSGSSSGQLKKTVSQQDYVFTTKLTQLGTGVYAYSLTYIFLRHTEGGGGADSSYLIEINDSSNFIKLYRQYTDGTIIEIAPLVSFSPVRGTTYHVKYSVIGSAIKFKIWEAGTAEPQSWMMEATDSAYNSGIWEVYSYQLKSSVDDICIYKSHTVTCSGLTDGQKFRVGGAAGKIAAASGGVATVDCSHLTFPVSLVEVLDASENVVMSFTATGDIWGGDAFEMKFFRKFYADATLIKGGVKPVTLDAVLKRGGSGNFTVEAMMRATVSGMAAVDSVTRKNIISPFTADALVWRFGGTITGLSVLKKFGKTASFTAAANLQPFIQVVKEVPAECALFKPGVIVPVPTNAVLKTQRQDDVYTDARLMKRTVTSITVDARLQWVRNGTITGLSVLRKVLSPSITGAAIISKKSITAPMLVDAVIRRQLSAGVNTGAVMYKNMAGSITFKAVIKKVFQGNFTVHAGLPARYTGSVLAEAFITKTRITGFIPGAILFKVVNRSFGADAYIWDMDRYLIDLMVNIETSFQIDTNVTKVVDLNLNLTKQATFDLNVGFN